MGIEGKVVAITGASSGIGRATAKLLAAHGAFVVLGARREDTLAEVAEAIIANPMLNGETIRLDGAIRMAPN